MNVSDLKRFRAVYKCSQRMGADRILREFLDLPDDFIVPLSVSHGVDFFQWKEPIDLRKAEPIHWSYHPELYRWSSQFKPSILLPHPWSIVHSMKANVTSGDGDLVIAPPSSPKNDSNLHSLLEKLGYTHYSVLVKGRGGEIASNSFWNEAGVKTVSAGSEDDGFYERLYGILSRFDRVIGCNLSSALFFAASIGKPLKIIQNFTFRAYQRPDFERYINFGSQKAKSIVQILVEGHDSDRCRMSQDLLGFPMLSFPEICRVELLRKIEATQSLFYPPRREILNRFLGLLALKTRRTGFLNLSVKTLYSEFLFRKMYEMEVNDVSLWLYGCSEENLKLRKVEYQQGVTEGGRGF